MSDIEIQGIHDGAKMEEWAEDGLESIEACPVCVSRKRRLLYSKLHDTVFFCAPGEWLLHSCQDCGTAYMDPRPTPETIHLAYRMYYTHQKEKESPAASLRGMKYIKRMIGNGYRNWRFNAKESPSSRLGIPLVLMLPPYRASIDHEYRHLPRTSRKGSLLDLGFGDGGFLERARSIGWEATGIDPDQAVVDSAIQRGLDVHQGDLSVLEGENNVFDVITMNHVIEHVHEPNAVLEDCFRLLKPGGAIWVETPNIDALGRARFQRNWRGLETPRHLVIFSRQSLRLALAQAGFTDVKDVPQTSACPFIYAMSKRMEDGLDPYIDRPLSIPLRMEIMAMRLLEWRWKARKEFLLMTARKGSAE